MVMEMVSAVKERLSNAVALQELERIRQEHGGILRAEDVVLAAEDLSSPLHNSFEWDDTAAAEQWRLQQARQIIRSVVVILPNFSKPINAFVSLRDDRTQEGGGYRTIIDVMSDKDMRERLLEEALAELRHWEQKYSQLNELAPVFEAVTKARKKLLRRSG